MNLHDGSGSMRGADAGLAVVAPVDASTVTAMPSIGLALGCAMLAAAAAWWAWAVPERQLPIAEGNEAPFSRVSASAEAARAASHDLAAFQAPLWVAPPAPPAPPPPAPKPEPEPPPPVLKWQLLAIVSGPTEASESGTLRAMIFDPETDSVIELAAGQRHGARTIETIEQGSVTVREGRHAVRLMLDDSGRGGAK